MTQHTEQCKALRYVATFTCAGECQTFDPSYAEPTLKVRGVGEELAGYPPRCPDCREHPGWAHGDESRRREPTDVCRACYGSGTAQPERTAP